MREIKFRAWDKCNERMVEPRNVLKICMSRLNQEPYLIVYLKKWMNENREIKEIDKSYTNEFELMQYTGLKDKNGVKIFEGDIVSDNMNNRYYPIFQNGIYMAYNIRTLKEDEKRRISSTQFNKVVIECQAKIIGNIYENPELLGVEK